MKLCELLEGLKPSQYRRYVQGWDKSKYNDIFNNKYRIELPTPPAAATNSDIRPDPNVVMAIQNAGDRRAHV